MAEEKYNKKTTSSFFNSPRLLFTNFTPKGFHETETTMMSPTSILDTKPFSGFKNPFWSETNSPRTPGSSSEHKRCWDKLLDSKSKAVGLGLVDSLVDEKQGEVSSKGENRMVLFGSQLKIQIPPLSPTTFSSNSTTHGVFSGCLSASEMELSEDYTRVISHGPNPRTTHIFDNCIIETTTTSSTSTTACFDVGCCSGASAKESGWYFPSQNFLSTCFYCKKNLGQGKDIYMYRGERAFCSHECRYQGMLLEEGRDDHI